MNRVITLLLALALFAPLSLGLAACGEQKSEFAEAVEEVKDEASDAREEIEDEIDDHS